MVATVKANVAKFLKDGKFVVTLVGAQRYNRRCDGLFGGVPGLSVLQIDAHTDLRQNMKFEI